MQGELCRYGNLVITSSSLRSPSSYTPSIWKGLLMGGGGGEEGTLTEPAQSFPPSSLSVLVITGAARHVCFAPALVEFAF